MTLTRGRSILFALAALVNLAAAPAQAEIKGLEIIAPANPGSGYDQTARAIQQALHQNGLAAGVQVVNIPGAGGTVGLAQFVSGKKPGPSLMMIASAWWVPSSRTSRRSRSTTPTRWPCCSANTLVVVPASSDIKTMADLVAKLKADPAAVAWGLGSSGGVDHVLAGQIMKAVGADPGKLKAVHYPGWRRAGGGDLGRPRHRRGRRRVRFTSQVKAGELRAFAVSSPERLAAVDAPTLKEQGVDVELGTWRGVMAHKQATVPTRRR